MSFPFSNRYVRELDDSLTDDQLASAMEYIKAFMEKKRADDVVLQEGRLTFNSGFFTIRWNFDILTTIDRGVFTIVSEGGKTTITYEIFMYSLFIIVPIMSIAIGLLSKEIWGGIGCFLWLGGMNWIIALTRHGGMFREIVEGIDGHLKADS